MSAFGGNTLLPNNAISNKNGSNNFSNGFNDSRRKDNVGNRKRGHHKNNQSGGGNKGGQNQKSSGGNRKHNRPHSKNNFTNNNGTNNNNNNGHFNKTSHNDGKNMITSSSNNESEENDSQFVSLMNMEPKVLSRQTDTQYQRYSKKEIQMTGPIINNPESLGFKPKSHNPREIPKFLQIQSRTITPIAFTQDPWDKQNQQKMNEMEGSNSGRDYQGLYEEFQRMRENERKQMESLGLVDAENIRKDLNDAISFKGTCLDMCPTFERVRRALENNVKSWERDPMTNKITKDKAVKAFSRPAAGQPPPLPSDVRPPHILKQTLDYLVETAVPKLPDSHSFIWDRTRSIRQDFTYQNYFGPEAVDCNERIVRIHLVSLHIMAGSDVEYSQQQEMEQFNKALQTLIEIYQDFRNRGGICPNEAEFRAYYLLSHLKDSEVEQEIQTLPDHLYKDSKVQLAIKIRSLISQSNIVERGHKNTIGCLNLFVEFFKLVYSEETPFLMACLLETQFNEIRFYALKSMSRAFHTRGKAYDGETLKNVLGFDSVEKLIIFVEYFDVDILDDDGAILVDLFNKEKLETKYKLNSYNEKPKLAQAFSTKLNRKITKRLSEFVNSGVPNDDLKLKTTDNVQILPSSKPALVKEPEVKAGSFADFLAKSSKNPQNTPSGFGGFGNTKKVPEEPKFPPPPKQNAQPAPTFSFTANKPSNDEQKPKPSFTFNQPPPVTEEPKVSKAISQPPPIQRELPKAQTPSFNFSAPLKQESKPISFNNLNNTTPSLSFKTEGKPEGQVVEPIINESKQVNPVQIPKVQETLKSKKLIDSAKFPIASREIYEMIKNVVVTEELNKVLPKVIKNENYSRERQRVINSLGKDLFQAFFNEILYKLLLDVIAKENYQQKLKKKIIKKIIEKGKVINKKQETKRKKLNELNEIKFNTLKRQSSNTSFTSSKRRHTFNELSIDEIVDKRSRIEKLWEPINLHQFLDKLSVKIDGTGNGNTNIKEFRFLILVENWKNNYSRWLNNKLSLKVNHEKSIYENCLQNNRAALNLFSLPQKDYLNKEFFKTTSFVLFECGILGSSPFNSIIEKLNRDKLILKKIIELIQKYGYYKLQIIIVYWDTTEKNLGNDEIKQILDIPSNGLVENVIICNMDKSDVSEILNQGFQQLSDQFTGQLTARGAKHRKKTMLDGPGSQISSTNLPPPPRPSSVLPVTSKNSRTSSRGASSMTPLSNDRFKANETRLLNKAKFDKKYSYLNNHSFVNNSINRSINHTNNNSTFMNSTILNSNNNSNMSILGNFGNEIIEESTPFSSPGKARNISIGDNSNPKKPPPKNLQQLIDLTSRVKSKYKS